MEASELPAETRPKSGLPHAYKPGQSGNPRGRYIVKVRANELFGLLSADLGPPLSAIDETLLRQACLLLARAERVSRLKDADVGIRMAGEARRILAMLKRTAPKHTAESSLADLLQQDHAEQRAAADAPPAPTLAMDSALAPRERPLDMTEAEWQALLRGEPV